VTVDCEQRIPRDEEHFRYIDIASVERVTKSITSPQTLIGKTAPSRARKAIRRGDVLVSMTRPNLNAVALVPSLLDGQIASTGFEVLRAPGFDPRWLFYLVRTESFVERMSDLVQGALYPAVRPKDIRGYEAPFAPLNEQKRIADKLDALLARVDTCREHLDRLPAILKRFRQAVLAAATSGELTEDWREQRNATNWETATVGELIDRIEAGLNVRCDERPPEEGERGLVKISAVTWGTYDDNESKTLSAAKSIPESTRIRVGDFLISRANTLELVGACVIVEKVTRPVFLSDKVLRLVMPDAMKWWMLFVLQSPNGRRQIESLASGNQLSMRNLSQQNLRSITVPLPEDDEREEIVRRVRVLLAHADILEARYAAARAQVERLTPALLAKAFRGELVPQDPNDEPAAVLLERIRAARAAQPAKAKPRKTERKATMAEYTAESVKNIISQLPQDRFTFDELRYRVPVDYEALKEIIFRLLTEARPCLRQYFDKEAGAMRFVRLQP
jgi:type I restriction enzyme, S subunit